MNNSVAKEMFANIQSRIGLKQFVIMATGCTTNCFGILTGRRLFGEFGCFGKSLLV